LCHTIARRSTAVRILAFWLVLLVVYGPPALVLYVLGIPDSWLAVGLYCAFVIQIGWWGRSIGGQAQPYGYYGLVCSGDSIWEFIKGLGLALLCFSLLMGTLVGMGGLRVQAVNWLEAIPNGLLTAIGVGFAEELLFRGWLLRELEQGYGKSTALGINSVIFAVLHFLKPLEVILATWVQFPGLVLLGLILGRACHLCQGRLGQAIGIHTGLVWGYFVVRTTNWLVPTGNLPEWLTGIGGNPLAGGMGLLYLGVMGLGLKLGLTDREGN
jgi:membrane protease YdiL (CAAX protease family)